MTPRSSFSAQTLAVLIVLSSQPSRWQHGLALAKETHLKSGTLYPILIRLADRGLAEAQWEDQPQQGRPRRHLYRLTAGGLTATAEALTRGGRAAAAAALVAPRSAARARNGRSVTAPTVIASTGP